MEPCAPAACDTPAAPVGRRPCADGPFVRSRALPERMTERLAEADMLGATANRVEEYITEDGRELERQPLQDHLDLRAATEEREVEVIGADQVARRRAEHGRSRRLATTVGRVEVTRIAYRAPGVPALHPAGAALALPAALYSYPLRRQVVHEAATGSLRQARDALIRSTGRHLGTRQLMEICTAAAADIGVFYALRDHHALARSGELSENSGELLVMSVDATGVSMIPADLRESVRAAGAVRAGRAKPPSAQLSARDKPGRRRMATVTADGAGPAPRTPAGILPGTAAERAARTDGPTTGGRVVAASLARTPTRMIHEMFEQAHARGPRHRRRWIALADGNNHQIDRIRHEAAARGVGVTIVIDIVHVIEYCWRAAEDLHRSHAARAAWVNDAIRAVLEGHSARVVAELRTELGARTASADHRPATGIARTLACLDAKQPCLACHIALTLGFPIATGVIEGCCRFIVKDRLDVTGARWSLTGAGAVLALRAVIANGDIDEYWAFHLQREPERTHATRYQGQRALAA